MNNSKKCFDKSKADNKILDLTVQPGSDDTSLQFNWITTYEPQNTTVEIAPADSAFDANRTVYKGESRSFKVYDAPEEEKKCRYENKVTVTGLTPGTNYRYRIVTGNSASELHTVSTQKNKNLKAYVLSDIHVIDVDILKAVKLKHSVACWNKTAKQLACEKEAGLILSIGDQMQNTSRTDYLDGFFDACGLADFVLAPLNGNHDISPDVGNLSIYTNIPNAVYPGSKGISDYYFTAGNVLFIMLSLTDVNFDEVDHDLTFRKAIDAYPDHDWMVVGFHEAIYGSWTVNYKKQDGDAMEYCNRVYEKFITLFDRYKPDLCLTGHSHSYCRSHFIRNGVVTDDIMDNSNCATNPKGTLYINMALSCRMLAFKGINNMPNWPWRHVAFSMGQRTKDIYAVLETKGNVLQMEVRDLLKKGVVLDRFSIVKTENNKKNRR